jgi:hypothetical protein
MASGVRPFRGAGGTSRCRRPGSLRVGRSVFSRSPRRTGSPASPPSRAAGPRPAARPPARPGAGPAGRAGRFHRRHGMDGRAQVEGLQAAAAAVAVGERLLHALQHVAGRRRWAGPPPARAASSSVWRIFSPPGTSPTPVRPALSVSTTRLRVKNGPWAPLRLSSMLSRPATGWRAASQRGSKTGSWSERGVVKKRGCCPSRQPAAHRARQRALWAHINRP